MRHFLLAGLGALMAATPAFAQAVSFDTFVREDAVTDYRQVFTIDGLGEVQLVTEEPSRPAIRERGRATRDQLQALDVALRQARFMELPAGTPNRGGGYAYRLTAPGGPTKRYSDGLGESSARLRPVDNAVRAIIDHLHAPQAVSFDTFVREDAVTNYRQVFTIDGLGEVRLVTEEPSRPAVSERGRATRAQLQALDAALRQARFMELPAGTPNRGGGYVYSLTAPGGPTKRYSDGLGESSARLRPVDNAVRAIIDHLHAPQAVSFDTFVREDAVTDYRQVFTIDGLGEVRLVTEEPSRPAVSERGRATRAQLQALDAALRQARFMELPAGTPNRGGGYVYSLTAPGGPTKRYSDGLGESSARLRPVDDAVRAIIESIARAPIAEAGRAPTPETRGVAEVLGEVVR